MKWIIEKMIEEYGNKNWQKMTEQDRLDAIVFFCADLKKSMTALKRKP